MIFRSTSTPSWIILIIDLAVAAASLFLAYLLRFNFVIPEIETATFPLVFPVFVVVRLLWFFVFGIHKTIIRYTNEDDTIDVLQAVITGSLSFLALNFFRFYVLDGQYVLPMSILIIEAISTTFLMVLLRMAVHKIYFEYFTNNDTKQKVLIYGAGESGIITKRTLTRDAGTKYSILGFVDDDPKKFNKVVEGITIFPSSKLEWLIAAKKADSVIISIQNLKPEKKDEIFERCSKTGAKVQSVPPVFKWIKGELSFNQIRNIKIEDLLGREVIQLNNQQLAQDLANKTILITGAAGSIGSELVRQLVQFNCKQLILVDQAESPLHDLTLEINALHPNKSIEPVIADITNRARMERVFTQFKPQILFHAAAYKHVPLMELNPYEAIHTNVFGTAIVADLAVHHEVEKFVMISTDKAVNPTNVMGASKRVAEQISEMHTAKTAFIVTRFGNVLGSNGSVIPLFKRQIESGGPITITHQEITRYFMTIPEACSLVLEAFSMGNGGEVFIFDMGESVKIVDLAKKMIRLAGLREGKDIELVYTGLRPGEKLYEELLADKENTLPTHHPKILKAKLAPITVEEIQPKLQELALALSNQNNRELVKILKAMVPEFKSNNSNFEELDS